MSRVWHDLQAAVLDLARFRPTYVTFPFAVFALGFAACSECGEKFFPRLGRALSSKGEFSRVRKFDGERWELCVRGIEYCERILRDEPYQVFRRLMVKVIANYDFLKRGRRTIAPESVKKWLDRNGW